jgi:hypothetical protein
MRDFLIYLVSPVLGAALAAYIVVTLVFYFFPLPQARFPPFNVPDISETRST